MSKWLYQTGVGLIAWALAGIVFECVRHAPGNWWLWVAASVGSIGFWACLDWYASIKGRAQ